MLSAKCINSLLFFVHPWSMSLSLCVGVLCVCFHTRLSGGERAPWTLVMAVPFFLVFLPLNAVSYTLLAPLKSRRDSRDDPTLQPGHPPEIP